MIRLSSVIEQFESDFMVQYAARLLPSQAKALAAMKTCRNRYSPLMKAHCDPCDSNIFHILVATDTARIASIMNLNNGWKTSVENRCRPTIS